MVSLIGKGCIEQSTIKVVHMNNVKIAQCDRECVNCISRNHCPEDCHRAGGCMEFQPDMSIPEVAEAEAQG